MEMSIDQARREISAVEIDRLNRFVIAKADNASIIDCDIGRINFAAHHINEPGVLK